jgi:hypothetical protein
MNDEGFLANHITGSLKELNHVSKALDSGHHTTIRTGLTLDLLNSGMGVTGGGANFEFVES